MVRSGDRTYEGLKRDCLQRGALQWCETAEERFGDQGARAGSKTERVVLVNEWHGAVVDVATCPE